jgi:hypothetical protein
MDSGFTSSGPRTCRAKRGPDNREIEAERRGAIRRDAIFSTVGGVDLVLLGTFDLDYLYVRRTCRGIECTYGNNFVLRRLRRGAEALRV